jgi:hypothetical protein
MADLDLYKLVLDEYRFQVQLNWDRTKFFLTLNLSLLGVTATLLKVDRIGALAALALFFLGFTAAIAGNRSLIKGHEYYRNISLRKAELEQKLGFTNPEISSTAGQKEAQSYLGKIENWVSRPLRSGSITIWLSRIFFMITLLNFLGILMSIYLSFSAKSIL